MPAAPSRSLARAALVGAASLFATACAAPQPMTVSPGFTDRSAPARPPSTPAHAVVAPPASCRLKVAELVDARRSPEIFGVVGGMAIKAPADTKAWLRSVFAGLGNRGFDVTFDADAPLEPNAVVARVRLQSTWLNTTSTNKTATVVLHLKAERSGATPVENDVRSNLTKVNWDNTSSEMQHLVDAAFVNALDQVAADLRPLCPG